MYYNSGLRYIGGYPYGIPDIIPNYENLCRDFSARIGEFSIYPHQYFGYLVIAMDNDNESIGLMSPWEPVGRFDTYSEIPLRQYLLNKMYESFPGRFEKDSPPYEGRYTGKILNWTGEDFEKVKAIIENIPKFEENESDRNAWNEARSLQNDKDKVIDKDRVVDKKDGQTNQDDTRGTNQDDTFGTNQDDTLGTNQDVEKRTMLNRLSKFISKALEKVQHKGKAPSSTFFWNSNKKSS